MRTNSKLGLSYMGSKRMIADKLLDFMLQKETKYFYDLCGGGGAMSFAAAKRGLKVYYNEIDFAIYKLMYDLKYNKRDFDYKKFVTKEEFDKNKNHDGYLKSVWSFNSNHRTYMYSKKNMEKEELLHNVFVNKCNKSRLKLDFRISYEDMKNKKYTLKHLQKYNHLLKIIDFFKSYDIKLSNLSYENVKIRHKKNAIIYIDPPYKSKWNDRHYNLKFDFDKLTDYVLKSDIPTFVSEYAYDGLQEVFKIEKTRAFDKAKVFEKLFIRRYDD